MSLTREGNHAHLVGQQVGVIIGGASKRELMGLLNIKRDANRANFQLTYTSKQLDRPIKVWQWPSGLM